MKDSVRKTEEQKRTYFSQLLFKYSNGKLRRVSKATEDLVRMLAPVVNSNGVVDIKTFCEIEGFSNVRYAMQCLMIMAKAKEDVKEKKK